MGRLGRRRPYFLAGAILSSMALIPMARVQDLYDLRHPSGSLPGNAAASATN